MKIRKITANNRKRMFDVYTARHHLAFPYAKADPVPTPEDKVVHVYVDPELGREAFTYELESGRKGSMHLDGVLDYNEDPEYMAGLVAHELKVAALMRMERTPLSRRELCRRLGTSASQLYRQIDVGNERTSMRQLLALLYALGADVSVRITDRKTAPRAPKPRPRAR